MQFVSLPLTPEEASVGPLKLHKVAILMQPTLQFNSIAGMRYLHYDAPDTILHGDLKSLNG